ncbi:hydroxyethylthiazole kinase [Raineyella antarctica]|uniref:Hydroxyethylthiazole kinase n=1 Tax=Raineyella antarctica TaxID=1577474 RepID=A0A1G6HRD9_9ACTN|nr:hydroxyethylthiazole kinase [Raineyella antarctica]SDB96867.1 hydroxyethylthiazole kinase [Raineyella antarctica]
MHEQLALALEAYRRTSPLVHCLTNTVVTNFTANVVLASGGAPAMVDNPQEAAGFAAIAGGVLVNLGTPQEHTVAAMGLASASARDHGVPWVLDPVGAGGLPWRTQVAVELLDNRPTIVRGNASEVLGLTGGSGGKGVDSTETSENALAAARALAQDFGSVVAVSGPTDYLTDGHRVLALGNGVELMTRVTGVGCALGALMAGFAAATPDALVAAAAATTLLCLAAEEAPKNGPGSFAVGLLDALSTITPDKLADRARLEER